ncbi:MAG: [FeFe] hydrogenase H-cluster radical SAM maturase HydE [Clostridiales bacterium]|nr:[FeFe] hydrogenase H-cluster radical SAM maturase HydE [Clostridiales bacterium]
MYKTLIDKLSEEGTLTKDEFLTLIEHREEIRDYAYEKAVEKRRSVYGDKIYIRGLIEFTNYCKNNCYYCGIRAANAGCQRYRLTPAEISSCADMGYELGFRTFVLQGGEDPFYTDDILCSLIEEIKKNHPDCAITLSLGERSSESYRRLKEAGADRYLLRHETADKKHYEKLHPDSMSFDNRQRCIKDLKTLGYQVGVGFMVGSPYQTNENLAQEMLYIKEIRPQMVGIGPFIPHGDTPFAKEAAGSAELTCFLLSLMRISMPDLLIPATTALGTIDPMGREKGIMAGANVLMPNLSPSDVRGKYLLYDNKICTGDEAAQCLECLKVRIRKTGCKIVTDRGDHIERTQN